MKKTFLSMLAVALMLGGASRVMAADKPAAVVSIASYDTLLKDVDFVGQLADMPDASKGVEGLLAFVTQGKGLQGLDKTKPLGVAVYLPGGNPTVVAFVPVTDLKSLLALTQQPIQESDGVFQYTSPFGVALYAQQKGGWAIISQNKDALGTAPADPSTLLDGLDKKYALAIRANIQNIPAEQRDMAMLTLRSAAEQAMRQNPGEDEASFEVRRKLLQAQLTNIDAAVKDLNDFTIGWAIDPSAKKTHLDISATAVAGSKLAGQFADIGSVQSEYTGFEQTGSAVNLNFASKVSEADAEQAEAAIKELRAKIEAGIDKDPSIPEDGKASVKEVTNELVDVVENTLKAGKLDGGAVLMLEQNTLQFAAGGFVKDGAQLETAVKKLVAMGSADANFPKVTLDAETYKGIRMHTMAVPMKDQGGQKVFGDTLDITLGIGKQSAYVALGKENIALLKKVIDASASATGGSNPPMQLTIALTPILNFINATSPNPGAQMAAQALSATPGKDHIRLTVTKITDGANYRLEFEEGILKAVATAVKANAGARRAGGPTSLQPN